MIQNPTPITANTFNGMWVTNMAYFAPTSGSNKPNGLFITTLAPYDGNNLLLTNSKRVAINNVTGKRTTDTQFDAIVTSLITEVKRQANKTVEPVYITVNAFDPSRPVVAQIGFTDNTNHVIKNCYALASIDSTFAGVFMSVMAEIARQAGLPIV